MSRSLAGITAVIALAIPSLALADSWQIDPPHTSAAFSVRHMGISTVRGAFTKVSGKVEYDPADVSKSSLEVTIDAASVDTRVEQRDNHLRSPDFLDVAKYPTITFISKHVEQAGPGKLKIAGDLTIHGTTKRVVLDVEGPSDPIKDPRGGLHMGASATTTINRQDFGVSGLPLLVGNDISITIDVEVLKMPAR
jgi:polyisoprenoid-binding protein YceI